MTKTLMVLIDGAEIGEVAQDSRGKFHFTYDDAYRKAPFVRIGRMAGMGNLQ